MSEELIDRLESWALNRERMGQDTDLLREAIDALSRPAPAVQVPDGMVLVSERIARLAISNLDPEDCRGAAEAVSGLSAAIHGDSVRVLAAPATVATEAVAQGINTGVGGVGGFRWMRGCRERMKSAWLP